MFVSAVVTAFLAIPFLANSVFADSCARSYTVQEGDWCDTISAANNASTYQLRVVNIDKIDSNCDNLVPGEVLCLGTTGADCKDTYVVQSGDNCGQIATNHGLNSTIFNINNPQLNADCDNLYSGEVVCVATSVTVPDLPAGSPLPAATPPAGSPLPAATPPAAVTSSTSVAIPTTATPSPNSVVSTAASVTPTPAPSASADDNNGDDDEDDLPWCDEI